MNRQPLIRALIGIGVAAGTFAASASPLSDSELFFDPHSMVEGFYPTYSVPPGGSLVFTSSPGREIIGANILPLLLDNEYGPYGSYTFSQSDYAVQPNQPGGYFADLTFGTLTTTFEADSPYHLRVLYSDNTSEMHTVFITGGLGGTPYGGQDQANRAAPWKKVPAKTADLFIISTGPVDDGFVNSANTLIPDGPNKVRVSTIQQARDAIAARSAALGRKIKVVMIGHGFQGSIRLGHGDNAERINNSGNANTMSGTDFGNAIKDHVSMINLFGCDTGGGAAGGTLLQDITNTGVMAQAYTSTVGLTNRDWFAYTWGTKVPTPGTLALLALAGFVSARRRR